VETELLETDVNLVESQDVKIALYHQTVVFFVNFQKSYTIKNVLIYAQQRNSIEPKMKSTVNHVLQDAILVLMTDVSHVKKDINFKVTSASTYVMSDKLKLMENAKIAITIIALIVIQPKRNV